MAGGEGRGGSYKNAAASRFGRSSGQAGKTKRAIAGKMLGIGTYGHLLDQGARSKPKKATTTKKTTTKSTRSAGSGKKTVSKAASKKAGSKAYSTGAHSSQAAARSVGYKSNIQSQRR